MAAKHFLSKLFRKRRRSPKSSKEEGTEYFLEKTEKAGVRISDSGINKQKIQIKKDKKYQWYEKEQYYGIQVKIQKEILYPDQNLEKEKQKEILFCLVKS